MLMRVLQMALAGALVAIFGFTTAHAAFIVEADNVAPAGKANDHFAATPANGFSLSTVASSAVGLAGNQSAFGNPANATGPDLYTFRYTPGTDADNTVLAADTVLGTHRLDPPVVLTAEPQLATGLAGGRSGLYNVYITWPNSGNVNAAGSTITVNSDGAPIVLTPVSQNGDPDPMFSAVFTEVGAAGNNKWLKIANAVPMTAGTTYTVSMLANAATFTSQRVHGVMWERAVPEPSAAALLGISALVVGLLRRRSA
jgi:hypothetical protein